ncbi:MAG: hypothetical protein ABEJ31_09795 [Haloarculaceae archaeon]
MKRRLALSLVVVLAGCAGLPQPDAGGNSPGGVAPADSPDGPAGGYESEPDPARTPVPAVRRRSSPPVAVNASTLSGGPRAITVGLVENESATGADATALREAAAYWNTHAGYADYDASFEYVADAADADVRVRMVPSPDRCGYEQTDRVVGCAPLYPSRAAIDPPASVEIETGYGEGSTRVIMIHELGHVLGVRHGEPPQRYMSASAPLFSTAQPNASARAYPWRTRTFRIYAALDGVPADRRETIRAQLRHVADYYERVDGRDPAVPEDLSIRLVDDRSRANVVVRFPERLPTGRTRGSTLRRIGRDPDGDGAIETYANATISVAGVEPDATGWYVGHWFGCALGVEADALPAPFTRAGPRDRRSAWWDQPP